MTSLKRLLLALLTVALLLASAVSANVTLHRCDTAQKVIEATTDTKDGHHLFFYDSLDVNSMRVLNTLNTLNTQRNHVLEALDIRNPQTAWLLSTFEVFYVPTMRYVKWTPNGRKILEGFQGMDFSPMSLGQYLDRH